MYDFHTHTHIYIRRLRSPSGPSDDAGATETGRVSTWAGVLDAGEVLLYVPNVPETSETLRWKVIVSVTTKQKTIHVNAVSPLIVFVIVIVLSTGNQIDQLLVHQKVELAEGE